MLASLDQKSVAAKGKLQCAGPQDREQLEVQVSMSQREPATRPTSRRSSRSPIGGPAETTSSQLGQPAATGHDATGEAASFQRIEITDRPPQTQAKSLNVSSILNPSEGHVHHGDAAAKEKDQTPQVKQSSQANVPWATGGTRAFPPGQPLSSSYPGTPVGTAFTVGPSMSERSSPAVAYQPPNLNAPSNVHNPRVSRPSSVSYSARSSHDFESRRHTYGAPVVSPAKRAYEPEVAEERGSFQAAYTVPRTHGPPVRGLATQIHGVAHASATPMTPTARPMSQPVSQAPEVSGVHRERHVNTPPLYAPTSQFHHTDVSGQIPGPARPPEGVSQWSEVMRRTVIGAGPAGIEGQQAYMTLPGSDIPIPVQVDYSQASKKADEKRQRNAKASTRHRRKKKTLQEENVRQLQDLRDERQDLADEIEQVKRQRDFYHEERNRLRDIVLRTPGIHQLAAGPPSPTPTRSTGSQPDRSPVLAQTYVPAPTQGYRSESLSADRPSQRQGMDDRSEFPTTEFTPLLGVQQAGLWPAHGQSYPGPARPASATSSGSAERLPPLRAMEGAPPPVQHLSQGQAQEQDPRTGQWRQVPARHTETGWATMTRKPGDNQPQYR